MAKTSKDEQLRQQNVEQTVSKSDEFYNKHKKTIWTVVICVVVVGLAVLAYSKWVYAPSVAEAQEAAFPAEAAYAGGEYQLALEGDGTFLGFADLVDQYGSKAGKSVYLYAGSCEAQLGNWEEALSYLKKYKGGDRILEGRALALEGDCYSALEDYDAALKSYRKAADKSENVFSAAYLVKAGEVCLHTGDKAQALSFFEEVKDKYPQSIEGYDIDKYIELAK